MYTYVYETQGTVDIMTAATCLPVDELRLFVSLSFLSSYSGREGRGNLEIVNADVRYEDGRQTGKPCVFGGGVKNPVFGGPGADGPRYATDQRRRGR